MKDPDEKDSSLQLKRAGREIKKERPGRELGNLENQPVYSCFLKNSDQNLKQ
jgi:hypothetical protein